ncbi:MAG: DUF1236 domain-containing protein [Beijerinckiaceae bacterium]
MLRKTLISGAAVAALALSGAAFAQGSSGSSSSAASPSPNANPNATGPAPGLKNNSNDVPRATPGADRAQERTGTSGSATTTSQSKPGASGSGATGGQAETRGGARDNLTTGQLPQVQINDRQRTELRTHFRQANIRTVSRDQINIGIAVGAVLPSTVTFAPIPDPILTVVPAFRGYNAVRVGDQILIVDPGTRRIVYIFEA